MADNIAARFERLEARLREQDILLRQLDHRSVRWEQMLPLLQTLIADLNTVAGLTSDCQRTDDFTAIAKCLHDLLVGKDSKPLTHYLTPEV